MTSDVAAATTVFYTPAIGLSVPLWNGSTLTMTSIGAELSQATTDATKSPAAVVNNSNYDVFVWSDSGTIRATRGPPWTSDTARGSGAGTTELDFATSPGVPLNKNSITNGPAADRGTYVGTVRSNGTATIDMKFGTSAAGGGTATLGVWNLYNRVNTRAYVQDSTASWTYSSVTVRSADNSAGNRANFITGLAVDSFTAEYSSQITMANVAGNFASIGFGLDSTTVHTHKVTVTNSAAVSNIFFNIPSSHSLAPQIGFHFIQALENSDGTNTVTFTGAGATTPVGLEVHNLPM